MTAAPLLRALRARLAAAASAGAALSGRESACGPACAAPRRALSSSSRASDDAPPPPPPPPGAPHLHVQLEPLDAPNEGVFTLSLTRPEARNAIGRQMLRELAEALQQLAAERTTRCVVVRSAAPGVFCAGADLKERARMTLDESEAFVRDLRATLAALAALPMPTVAAVDGLALGGGAELALACDLRVAGAGAAFAFPETRLGIVPGAGGTQRLPRAVGRARAAELVFTARRVGAAEALAMGLADRGADAHGGEADAAALELAREIAAAAPLALRQAKRAINVGAEVDLASGLALEEACYAQLLPTRDRMEGLRAFAEKRPPAFTGE